MADYVTNTPISGPVTVPNVQPDVNLNGVSFNYDIGMFYPDDPVPVQFTLPPPFSAGA